jgi:hypothetical protein
MAMLWVTEFLGCGDKGLSGGWSDYPAVPAIATQTVEFTTSAATANAFSDACEKVAVSANADCHIRFGVSPTATTGDLKLQAGVVYMFTIGARSLKVAAVVAAA